MAERHNLCPNPACGVSVAGWGGGATPVQATVTGFDRSTAAHYTAGTFQIPAATPSASVTAGQVFTGSLYLRSNVFNQNSRSLLLEWLNASGNPTGSPASASFTLTSGVVARASVTGTAPSGATAVRLVVDGINAGLSDLDVTMVLIEQSAELGDYFDGDSDGGSWDGTPGLSTSTWTDEAEAVTGVVAVTLPALGATAQGTVTAAGAIAATLPPVGAGLTGTVSVAGQIAAALPSVTAQVAGTVRASGSVAAELPAVTAAATATVKATGHVAAALPALTASLDATVTASGVVDAHLPALTAHATATATVRGQVAAVLPALTAELTGTVERNSGTVAVVLPALTADLAGTVRVRGDVAAVLPPLAAAVSGRATVTGQLAVELPPIGAALAGQVSGPPTGEVHIVLPALTASLTGTSAADAVSAGVMAARDGVAARMTYADRRAPAMAGRQLTTASMSGSDA